jgi:hypothetical protein
MLLIGLPASPPGHRYWRNVGDDAGECRRRDRQTAGRHGSGDRTFHGAIHLAGLLPAVAGTIVLNEFHRLERQLFEEDLRAARAEYGDDALAHLAGTPAQRGADAWMLMAERSATMPAGARAPAPLFTVLVGYETFHGMLCELDDGTVVPPAGLLPATTQFDVQRVVFAGRSRVIDVGARARFFTGALQRAIQVCDRHCQHPSGCDTPAERCEVDHIVEYEYEDGGLTIQTNGRLECGYHNRHKHRTKRTGAPPSSACDHLDELRQRLRGGTLTHQRAP